MNQHNKKPHPRTVVIISSMPSESCYPCKAVQKCTCRRGGSSEGSGGGGDGSRHARPPAVASLACVSLIASESSTRAQQTLLDRCKWLSSRGRQMCRPGVQATTLTSAGGVSQRFSNPCVRSLHLCDSLRHLPGAPSQRDWCSPTDCSPTLPLPTQSRRDAQPCVRSRRSIGR